MPRFRLRPFDRRSVPWVQLRVPTPHTGNAKKNLARSVERVARFPRDAAVPGPTASRQR